MRIKRGLYKSLILPVLTYGLINCNISRSDLARLERFQKKVLKRITGNDSVYRAAEIVKHPASGVVSPAERVTDDGKIHA